MKILIMLSSVLFLSSCFDSGDVQAKTTFNKNCLVRHGKAGGGLVKDWKKRQADGNFPAPPVNGTVHTWHHPHPYNYYVLLITVAYNLVGKC
ncbi:hypothetical protein HUE58_00505 [Candidatus Ruthia endofausta]|uniref:Uncharacterized protein n=1 Tax=Candidatus Ruthia endofausta TaxID=2738852 RepID=A0A6N0HN09_9GAMM|nr:hypothetical protein [Candidatus Ruthia endofausta]QKQ23710.1 hypothetical protein HUE58_00505 [Candidatus Ruthia endofausta]